MKSLCVYVALSVLAVDFSAASPHGSNQLRLARGELPVQAQSSSIGEGRLTERASFPQRLVTDDDKTHRHGSLKVRHPPEDDPEDSEQTHVPDQSHENDDSIEPEPSSEDDDDQHEANEQLSQQEAEIEREDQHQQDRQNDAEQEAAENQYARSKNLLVRNEPEDGSEGGEGQASEQDGTNGQSSAAEQGGGDWQEQQAQDQDELVDEVVAEIIEEQKQGNRV